MGERRRIFVSYSHQDEEWLHKLKTFLRPLDRSAELEVWSDSKIQPSSRWHAEIQSAINDADAAILLVSPDFLASDYVASNELPQLLEAASRRGLKIFPVIVSACFLRDSPLLQFQALNSPVAPLDSLSKAEQNRLLTKLTESIHDLLKVASVGITDEWLERFRSDFVPIEGGSYIMGDNALLSTLHGLPEHEVSVASFILSKYVITQSQWTAVVGTQPWLNGKDVRYGSVTPAIYVSWNDAQDFVMRINKIDKKFVYRLPTEAEWEYAARGGPKAAFRRTKFCFGDDPSQLIQHGWHDVNASLRGENYAHAIGELSPNQLGLYDMHGNVWEWLADNSEGTRPLHGGGFNFMADGACSAFRVTNKAETVGPAVGFRLVQEPRS